MDPNSWPLQHDLPFNISQASSFFWNHKARILNIRLAKVDALRVQCQNEYENPQLNDKFMQKAEALFRDYTSVMRHHPDPENTDVAQISLFLRGLKEVRAWHRDLLLRHLPDKAFRLVDVFDCGSQCICVIRCRKFVAFCLNYTSAVEQSLGDGYSSMVLAMKSPIQPSSFELFQRLDDNRKWILDFSALPPLELEILMLHMRDIGHIYTGLDHAITRIGWCNRLEISRYSTDYTRQAMESDESSCFICHTLYEPRPLIPAENEPLTGEPARKLHCGHVFGADCLKGWADRSNTCPMCRRAMFNYKDLVPHHLEGERLQIQKLKDRAAKLHKRSLPFLSRGGTNHTNGKDLSVLLVKWENLRKFGLDMLEFFEKEVRFVGEVYGQNTQVGQD